jgi:hypothetical protein
MVSWFVVTHMVRKYKLSGIPKAYHVYQPIAENYFYARTRM